MTPKMIGDDLGFEPEELPGDGAVDIDDGEHRQGKRQPMLIILLAIAGESELLGPPLADERIRLAAAAFRRDEGRPAAAAADTQDPAMIELFLIVSGYLEFGDFDPDGERRVA